MLKNKKGDIAFFLNEFPAFLIVVTFLIVFIIFSFYLIGLKKIDIFNTNKISLSADYKDVRSPIAQEVLYAVLNAEMKSGESIKEEIILKESSGTEFSLAEQEEIRQILSNIIQKDSTLNVFGKNEFRVDAMAFSGQTKALDLNLEDSSSEVVLLTSDSQIKVKLVIIK